MFQFPSFASLDLCIQLRIIAHYGNWVPPFRDPRIKACLAAPRGLSQLATSFIAFRRQGIHRLLLVAWPYIYSEDAQLLPYSYLFFKERVLSKKLKAEG